MAISRRSPRAALAPLGLILAALALGAAPAVADEAVPAAQDMAVMAAKAQRSVLLDVADTGAGRWIAVGERGHVLLSDDQGKTWNQSAVPTSANLTAVHFADAEHGWAVGHDATILATSDGGQSWVVQYRKPEVEKPFLDVWFRNPMRGIVIGAYGMMLHTQDGGKTWEAQDTSALGDDIIAEPHLNALRLLSDGSLLLVGESGLIARSNDEGRSWTRLASPYEGSLFAIGETPGKALLVVGLRGHVYRSVDNAASWSEIATEVVGALNSVPSTDSGVYVLGNDGIVLRSQDDGRSFVKLQRNDRKAIATALAVQGGLLLVGETGVKRADADGQNVEE